MDLLFLFKIIFILGILVGLYAVIRNIDIIKLKIMKLKESLEKNNKHSAAIMMVYLLVLVAFAIIIA